MKIAIIGTGVYGLAMARSLSQNKTNDIIMWAENQAVIDEVIKMRKNYPKLNNLDIPETIKFTTDYREALEGRELVFILTAAQYVGNVAEAMRPFIDKKMHFIIGSKGIEQGTCRFVHEVFLNHINTRHIAVISGPSFAIDIANLEPIGLAVGTKNKETLKVLLKAYKGTNIKLRESNDLVGIETCGAIKNVIAVAAGILEGLGYSESTRAFLITESLHDIKELIRGLNGNKLTILSFAGVGDLLLTATSTKSRNYTYGVLLGQRKLEEAKRYIETTTVEGYYTLKSIYALLRKRQIKMPVIDLIYNIVMKDTDPTKLAEFLMKKK